MIKKGKHQVLSFKRLNFLMVQKIAAKFQFEIKKLYKVKQK